MAITYPLAYPALLPSRAKVRANTRVGVGESPWTFEQQAQVYTGQRWELELTHPPLNQSNAALMQSFLLSLNGRQGTFLYGDPAMQVPLGIAAVTPGTPLVKGASQTGSALIIDGMGNNVTGYMLAGSYIGLGSGSSTHMHMLLTDLSSDGTGTGTATIWPSLRTSPADNAPVTVSAVKGLFRLAANPMDKDVDAPFFSTFTLSATEAL